MKKLHFEVCDSTNTQAKNYLKNNSEDSLLITADMQTGGRGRQGKNFYSPQGTGIYMTYAYRANKGDFTKVTTHAAVAVCRALEKVSKKRLAIKWVNDIYLGDKKICGILTENIQNVQTGKIEYIIIGIGINLVTKDFPENIENIAGSLGDFDRQEIIDRIIKNLTKPQTSFMGYYRRRSNILKKDIVFIQNGVKTPAKAVKIDKNGGLVVKLGDNTKKTLTSGEISIKTVQNFVENV